VLQSYDQKEIHSIGQGCKMLFYSISFTTMMLSKSFVVQNK